jgi:TolA-binding protein
VAEQKAAGVDPENTVTMADQRAGVPDPAKAADDIIAAAREEYNNKNYDEALRLVDDAESLYPGIAEVAKQARMAIAAATTK